MDERVEPRDWKWSSHDGSVQSIFDLIEDRGRTHGNFASNAYASQSIKDVLRSANGWSALSLRQKEALEMIALEMSRIVSGNPNEPDHWDDIAGYARLAK